MSIDFGPIVSDLRTIYTLQEIADMCNKNFSWVSKLENGVIEQPAHNVGEVLLMEHKRLFRRSKKRRDI
jgi:hypothetical protein